MSTPFAFHPLPPIADIAPKVDAGVLERALNPLGPLQHLAGSWSGVGFNVIWRPHRIVPSPPNDAAQDRFLELNLTHDEIVFTGIGGPIPNRGLLQGDIKMFGLTYMEQIHDANLGAGLHTEPGIWAVVPATSDPDETQTVVRMASIPHGTAILAQGTATSAAGGPDIPDTNILPFRIDNPAGTINFPEQNLSQATAFRSDPSALVGVTQELVDNPNSALRAAIAGQTIERTTTLQISTEHTPVPGGGTANTAFLEGGANGPNANAVRVDATFWIETVRQADGTGTFLQLQYSQRVLLNFNTLSWPHVTVGTLHQVVPTHVPTGRLDAAASTGALALGGVGAH